MHKIPTRNSIYYIRRLGIILVLLLLILTVFFLYPFRSIFFPEVITDFTTFSEENQHSESPYVNIYTSKLYDTGYDNIVNGRVTGHYFYTVRDNCCMFFLLSPTTTASGEVIEAYQHNYKLIKKDDVLQELTSSIASSVEWNEAALNNITVSYLASEIDYPLTSSLMLAIGLCLSALACILNLLLCLLHFIRYLSKTRISF